MDLLSRTEEMILLAVGALGDEAYGVAIRRHLQSVTGNRISTGAIYVPLERLAERGWLESRQSAPTPERGGRSKRCYRLTADGLRMLRETARVHDDLWAGFPKPAGWQRGTVS